MQINPFVVPLPVEHKSEKKTEVSSSFGEMVREALDKVNRQQLQAQEATRQFLSGDMEDIHQLLIAGEQARISLQLTVQVTTKIIEAYREFSRLQV
ncbi:MAG: flagellar hook-basal body complex protein FliE [Firmicutes bacterium]|nr:flagellar hook-basal body complex protein FliE [Bacillota bacterium]